MSSRTFLQIAKKIGVFVLILTLIVIIKNISSSILSSFDRTKTVEVLEQTLYEKKQEQKYLQEKLEIAKTDSFVEEEARTKLGLTREGEQIVIDKNISRKIEQKEKVSIPNWQKWMKLFTS